MSDQTDVKDKTVVTDQTGKYVPYAVWGFFAVIMFYAWFSSLKYEPETKYRILSAVVGVVVFCTVVILAIVYRRAQNVALATNFILLLLMVCAFAVAPAVALGRSNQVILLKFGAVLFFSLLPGWLYLQFIIVKGKTLREEFILNLYRLHVDTYRHLPEPPHGSIFHERWRQSRPAEGGEPAAGEKRNNLYLRKFEGFYGESLLNAANDKGASAPASAAPHSRFHGENFLPVIVTTLLLAVGWALVVQPEEIMNLFFAGVTLSGNPVLPSEALRFGFVGSYFFILQMLVRRYFQDDLKTGAYINALTRVILVLLLVTAVNSVWPGAWPQPHLNAFAFLIGVFPQIGLRAIQALITFPLRKLLKSLDTDYPLSDLDGLNIWYESRLLEESIEDMQNLAKANLVDVILRTRIPVERLVDWVDQAHLCLHVNKFDRPRLRRLGVRTATDLENAIEKLRGASLLQNPHPPPAADAKDEAAPSEMLTVADLEAILETLSKEPNLYHVREWKKFTEQLEQTDRPQPRVVSAQTSGPASNGGKAEVDERAGGEQGEVAQRGGDADLGGNEAAEAAALKMLAMEDVDVVEHVGGKA